MSVCLKLCIYLSTAICFFVFLFNIIDYNNYISIEKTQCNITDVHYPTSIPQNTSKLDNFVQCDCGYNCYSELGTCISVYGHIIGSKKSSIIKIDYDDRNKECTEREYKCKNGEKISDREKAINNAINDAQKYEEMLNKNIDCYYDKNNNLYLENDFDFVQLYIIMSILSILLIISIIVLYKELCTSQKVNDFDIHLNDI